MLDSMRHEPFYSSGTHTQETAGLCIGWTRDGGIVPDAMPVTNEKKDLLLFFNGEHFPSREEINAMPAGQPDARNSGDGFALKLIDRDRVGGLKKLNGWFHGLLLDLNQNRITLFNDRYGMQRLYYYEDGDSLLFASEAKAILAARRELRAFDMRSLGEFVTCDCALQNRTLFNKVYTMPGGSVWTFRQGRLEGKELYFKPEEWESQDQVESERIFDELKDRLRHIMDRYTRSNVPVGISLTGGLDTRLIMAYLNGQTSENPTYTFGSMYRETHDLKVARKVAAACGQRHEAVPLGRDFFQAFSSLAEKTVYISDGGLSAWGAYELYLNRRARKIAPIRLTGNYGSEVFRGMRAFKAVEPLPGLFHMDYRGHIQEGIATFAAALKCHRLSFALFKQAPWFGYGRLAVEQSQIGLRTPFMDNELVSIMYRSTEAARSSTRLQWSLVGYGNPALLKIPTDRGLHGKSGPVAARWAYFVSHFAFKADYLLKSGMPQWMEQMYYFVRASGLERHMIGRCRFAHYRIWVRDELAKYIKEILLDPSVARRPYLAGGAFLEQMVTRHIKGDRNYTNEIDKILTMEFICRQFIDSNR